MESFKVDKMFSVKGKTAVITGGATGIGFMMGCALAANGGHVIIASRKEKELQRACDEVNKQYPNSFEYVVTDLSTKAGCDHLCNEVKKRVNKVHIVVANSGASWGAAYDEVPEKEGWDKIFNLNMKAVFYTIQGLTDLLAKDATNIDPGRAIVIASNAAFDAHAEGSPVQRATTGLWSYYSTKAGAMHLGKTLAVTLAPKKITCNVLCPGLFPSKMAAHAFKEHDDIIHKMHPMGRVGNAEDMAGFFLFLCSRASSHMSGQAIELDGGTRLAGRNPATKL